MAKTLYITHYFPNTYKQNRHAHPERVRKGFITFLSDFVYNMRITSSAELVNGNENGEHQLKEKEFKVVQEIYRLEGSRKETEIRVNELEEKLREIEAEAEPPVSPS